MDYILAGYQGRVSYKEPPAAFVLAAMAATLLYWIFLRVQLARRRKRQRRADTNAMRPPESQSDSDAG